MLGDARRLRESVEHVLRNAVAYTDEGGQILLRATGDDERAIITVARQWPGHRARGPGDGVRPLPPRRSAAGHGEAALGLGLPLTRQFIEAHGGTVELVSTQGKGTTVTLTIPRGAAMILADEAATRGVRRAARRRCSAPAM